MSARIATPRSFAAIGPGVERLRGGGAALFPGARSLVLSSDTLDRSGAPRRGADGRSPRAESTSSSARSWWPKGHHFPRLTLVGVVDADLGLGDGDLRAAERTFQLLTRWPAAPAAGAGPGVGYLQTHLPEHPVMKALIACDREAFYDARSRRASAPAIRRSAGWRA